MQREKIMNKIATHIDRVGWSLTSVFADPDNHKPGFAYTIGRHLKGEPEILVLAMPPEAAHHFVKIVIDAADKGEPLEVGVPYTEFTQGGLPMMLIECDEDVKGEYTLQANEYYGHRGYRVLQLVWSDPNGKFPWEDGFDHKFRKRQPLCGPAPKKQ